MEHMTELLPILSIGFVLGLRHALDPDHVVAVSTIASRTGCLIKAVKAGIYWGIGHTLILFVVGMVLMGLGVTVPQTLSLFLEMGVGVMIVILGWAAIQSFRRKKVHLHNHRHNGEAHVHFHSHEKEVAHQHIHVSSTRQKSFVVGMIHGFAGSGAMVLLIASMVDTLTEAALYILVFGGGTVFGMLICAFLMALPFIAVSKYSIDLERVVGMSVGVASIGFGMFFIYQIAFVDGLFRV